MEFTFFEDLVDARQMPTALTLQGRRTILYYNMGYRRLLYMLFKFLTQMCKEIMIFHIFDLSLGV